MHCIAYTAAKLGLVFVAYGACSYR